MGNWEQTSPVAKKIISPARYRWRSNIPHLLPFLHHLLLFLMFFSPRDLAGEKFSPLAVSMEKSVGIDALAEVISSVASSMNKSFLGRCTIAVDTSIIHAQAIYAALSNLLSLERHELLKAMNVLSPNPLSLLTNLKSQGISISPTVFHLQRRRTISKPDDDIPKLASYLIGDPFLVGDILLMATHWRPFRSVSMWYNGQQLAVKQLGREQCDWSSLIP
ncbi:hypothetical protein KSP40_PGU014987 [Platanthera guangdongensis]|uniref:Uncharacterized protein n=1 Tax=Platanthera guangdongensis TaxID=2320717 RepID=A0ABR2LFW8_9ASPA